MEASRGTLLAGVHQEGYNPNLWFNNVEIIAAREIGAETVTYFSNIYKYYVGYRMYADIIKSKKAAAK